MKSLLEHVILKAHSSGMRNTHFDQKQIQWMLIFLVSNLMDVKQT